MWCVRFIQRTCEPVRRQKCFLLEWSSRSAHEEMEFFWGLFVLVVMKVGVDVAIKSWEGREGGWIQICLGMCLVEAWLVLWRCLGALWLRTGPSAPHLYPLLLSALASLAQRPLQGGARTMLPKTYLTFVIYPALSQAHQPPPHIEPASTHQHDGLNDL